MTYPTLIAAAKLIAYDNGMINRNNTEEAVLDEMLANATVKFEPSVLDSVEKVLSSLPEDELFELCCGEYDETFDANAQAVLNAMFEG